MKQNINISAIYFALLQCDYNYFKIGRSNAHIESIDEFAAKASVPDFFSAVKQNTCEVYPFWPRAALLETASFYLISDYSAFFEFDKFRDYVMSAGNLSDIDRNQDFWCWIIEFPNALKFVINSDAFKNYYSWEKQWVENQAIACQNDLKKINECIDVCIRQYNSPFNDVQIVLSPIKCAYSADFHLVGNSFVYSSGTFAIEPVIHEFLHHLVHPKILLLSDVLLKRDLTDLPVDKSYYLTGGNIGRLNAFEEFAVRELTKNIINEKYPKTIDSFCIEISSRKNYA